MKTECGAVILSVVLSLCVASVEQLPLSPLCGDCEFFRVGSGVGFFVSLVSLVSLFCRARLLLTLKMCPEELGLSERGEGE